MNSIPKSAQTYYKMWVSAFPESEHRNDWVRFYMFVSTLLRYSKKERNRHWLERCLKRDCKKLTNERVQYICDIYDHLKNYSKVWKGDMARLLARDEMDQRRRKLGLEVK